MMMPVDRLWIQSKIRRLWHRQRDRYATPRCVRVKTSGKGVQPFLLAIAGFRRLRSDLAFRASSILSLSLS